MKKIILIALSAISLHAYADDAVPPAAPATSSAHTSATVNGKLSTLGLGVEVAFPMTQSVDARLGLNAFTYSFNKSTTTS